MVLYASQTKNCRTNVILSERYRVTRATVSEHPINGENCGYPATVRVALIENVRLLSAIPQLRQEILTALHWDTAL